MKFERRYSKPGYVASQVDWKTVTAEIPGVFKMENVTVPSHWSQNAANILAQKYFRKAGVPLGGLDGVEQAGMPSWLWPRKADGGVITGSETSASQVFHRLAGCWTYWGWREGLFSDEENARVFYDELFMMLALQVGAPNSPQWFNTGLHWAYGIEGPASGQWAVDYDAMAAYPYGGLIVRETRNSYERPQPHACFIQPITDDLVGPGGIMDLWVREVRLFKHGSGTGTNFSTLRAKNEKLSGGGRSSGLMSFLRIGDRAAGSIKSGGTTRRAAKMVIVDVDHPDVEEFIDWKMLEERKARALVAGSKALNDGGPVYTDEWEGEATDTVGGQNSNNSIRVTNEFMSLALRDPSTYNWPLTARTTGETMKWVNASELWRKICVAAHACADPGLQFHDTINAWHTCSADGPIRASNPCSEYMFLDNTACNLASLRLGAFQRDDGSLDLDAYEHAVRLWTVVLEISVYMAAFPSREIAEMSEQYRTLGLGYADLGGMLMRLAIPYDSDKGRSLAAALTALMTAVAYRTSAAMADELGPFSRWPENQVPFRAVMQKHADAVPKSSLCIDFPDVWKRAKDAWELVLHARCFRNAQVTLLAPTGTISLVMDCGDFTGVEPAFALVAHKHLAGGGSMKIVNQAVEAALVRLEYNEDERRGILLWLRNHGELPRYPVAGSTVDLEPEHLPIFACANEIDPIAHVKMVAAVQPFLSGAVSKTINMPASSTVRDVSNVYHEAYHLGLKAVAIYRDKSKMTQPLSDAAMDNKVDVVVDLKPGKPFPADHLMRPPVVGLKRSEREYPPWKRTGHTQKVKLGQEDQSIFLTVNTYPDGRPCEMFLELAHQGSTLRAMANLCSMAVSIGLQYGVPVAEYVDRFLHTKFEPAGVVEGHSHISTVSSVGDLIARHLAIEFLGREDQKQPMKSVDNSEAIVALDKRAIALASSEYVGELCKVCGNATMKRAGSCLVCETCGETTGCG